MNTKKDFERAAKIVNDYPADSTTSRLIKMHVRDAFVNFFRNDNPKFNRDRFITACKVEL